MYRKTQLPNSAVPGGKFGKRMAQLKGLHQTGERSRTPLAESHRRFVHTAGRKRRARPLQIISLKPARWVGGMVDAHWEYIMTTRKHRQILHRTCRFSQLRDLVMHVREEHVSDEDLPKQSVFEDMHWFYIFSKWYADTEQYATDRGSRMLLELAELIHDHQATMTPLIEALPLADQTDQTNQTDQTDQTDQDEHEI